jgi:tetratricopeptide (TPR) repeat protein
MNISHLRELSMKVSRTPRELEQLRTATRMNMYLELKQLSEKHSSGRYTKAESGRISMEIERQLCGDPVAPGVPPLPAGIQQGVVEAIALIKAEDPDVLVAASFMRWSKAVGLLMKLKNQEAEPELEAAIEYDPGNAFALCSMAYLAGFQGDAREALALSKRALEINPNLPEALLEMGNAYETLGEHAAAMEAWEKAKKLSPDMVKLDDKPETTGEVISSRERLNYEVLTDESEGTAK